MGSTLAVITLLLIKTFLFSLMSAHWSLYLGIPNWSFLSFAQILVIYIIGMTMALMGGITVFLRFQEQTL